MTNQPSFAPKSGATEGTILRPELGFRGISSLRTTEEMASGKLMAGAAF